MNNDKESKQPTSDFLNLENSKTKYTPLDIPKNELPEGGGAIKGIDEKFVVNSSNGTASFSVPLPFSKPRGVAPSLTLNYNSGNGNSIFGIGWGMEIGSIKRRTDRELPKYQDKDESDVFLFASGEDLVPEFQRENDGSFSKDVNDEYIFKSKNSSDGLFTIMYYKPRVEGIFSRIEKWSSKTTDEVKWRIISGDNVTTLLGWTSASRLVDKADSSKIYEWKPEFTFDAFGNCVNYIYKFEDDKGLDMTLHQNKNRFKSGNITYTNLYIDKIYYGNKTPYVGFGTTLPLTSDYLFETVLDYGQYSKISPFEIVKDWNFRADAFSDYKPGFELRTTRLCERILTIHHFDELVGGQALVRSIDFTYDTSVTGFTFLKSMVQVGYIKKPDGSYSMLKMPETEFDYQKLMWNTEVKTLSQENLIHDPVGLSEKYQFTDLYSEGLSGILTESANGWYYKQNLGNGQFEVAHLVNPKPNVQGFGDSFSLQDLDGNGTKQIVNLGSDVLGSPSGFFEIDDDENWKNFSSFQNLPNVNFRDANARLLDINGDGKSDILVTEDNAFAVYESNGKLGFSPVYKTNLSLDEEDGPRIIFKENLQTIYLADMTGDGLNDIVRIRASEICYWPNLGYGKFGAKVNMDSIPTLDSQDSFNPSLVRLADIDGSGTADLVYLGKFNVSIFLNLNGNSFANAFTIDPAFEINNSSNVTFVDLLGNGVPCIVWSSDLEKDSRKSLKYIDLCESKKPHLMKGYVNNLGKEVTWEYTPSTKFYIEDKLASRPWVTKLHFPVQCISKTTTVDKITGSKFTTTYKYHHGYFDHIEKEFRGFGMVEQIDSEFFENYSANSSQVVDKELFQFPILIKSWYHTGAYLSQDKILNAYTHEYWFEEMQKAGFPVSTIETQLPEPTISGSIGITPTELSKMSGEEWQQAVRSCKGMTIRTEVFAKDAPTISPTPSQVQKELSPFSSTLQNCSIQLVQPKGKNRYAIYTVKESESLVYNYERNIDDSRISHKLNIKLDEYGNVLESASVVYPRLNIDSTIPLVIQAGQGRTNISYSENIFTNDIDTDNEYHLRMPSQTRTYELKGVKKTGALYKISDFVNVLSVANEVNYEMKNVNPPLNTIQKRKVEEAVNLFYSNNLSTVLPLNTIESLAMSYESYQLVLIPTLVTDIFGSKVGDTELLLGKYMHLNGDLNWWMRTGVKNYLKSGETITNAKNRFFLPVSYTDAWGAVTKVKYFSNYNLMISELEDVLGNVSKVLSFNMRTLTPKRLQDVNENITEVLQDELGRVKAVAVFGKGSEADDLSGLEEFSTPSQQVLENNFLNATNSTDIVNFAKSLLTHATLRYIYDQAIYKTSGGTKPAVVSTITREEHFAVNALSKIQVMFEYSNGTGEMVMKKMQAEPGVASKINLASNGTFTISNLDTSAAIPSQLRWIGNGRTVKNNKGNIVKQYEPYFSVSRDFENVKELVETGVTPILYYDALGRLIKTEYPNDTFKKVEFDAWKQIEYDPNDNTLSSKWYIDRFNRLIDAELIAAHKDPVKEKEAAIQSAKHDSTPKVIHLDSLGRPTLQIEHNRDLSNVDEFYNTILEVDFEGNILSVTDARGIELMSYKYDMLGNIIYHKSSDSGQRWLFQDIVGRPLRTWDERLHEFQFEYDILGRPLTKKIKGGDGLVPLDNIYFKAIYGEGLPNAIVNNFNLKAIVSYDTAGKSECKKFDFKGDCLETSRRFCKNYKNVPDWGVANPDNLLESETHTTTFEFDALKRIQSETTPDGTVYAPVFNEAGLLDSVDLTQFGGTQKYIKNINYNEKGQREKITYGNDVSTNYIYDKFNFRLVQLTTKRKNNDPIQDLYYTTDPVGNVTHVEDKNVPVVFFNNSKITGTSTYKYDSIYRLIESTGREHIAQTNFGIDDNFDDLPFMKSYSAGDPFAFRNYTQQYAYDNVGNFSSMKHIAVSNNWTRNYQYSAINNRMTSTDVGVDNYTYDYHPKHGFISQMPHLQVMKWNFREELSSVAKQKVNSGSPETTYYVYDSDGKRVRKITENASSAGGSPLKKNERIYIGLVEIYREFDNLSNITLERKSYHVVDDKIRFAMIENLTIGDDGSPSNLVRYQLSNQIGSSCIEFDGTVDAKVISYEEYHPFGTTSYQAVDKDLKAASKRYRFTGKERDEESGFEYHGARYYLPWLGRWANADPIGLKDNLNVYCYVSNNPLRFDDPTGMSAWDRFCGGLKMVGGALETVAGVGLVGVGIGTSEVGVGIAIGAGGVVVTAHGADTFVSGWRTLWNGEQVDSFTSQGLQAAGVSRPNANLADAGISIVGTLGANLATRAPTVVAVVTEEGVTQAPNVAPSVSLAFKPVLGGAGHNMVGVTTADGVTTWTHLVVDATGRTSGVVTSGEAFVVVAENGPSAAYSVIRIPVTAAAADSASAFSNGAVIASDAANGAGAYNLLTNSCSTYAASVLGEAGVVTPGVTSPLLNYTSAALQSSVVMQPLTTAGVVVNTTVAVTQLPDALEGTAEACELPPEQQVCVAPPATYGPPPPPPPAPVASYSSVTEVDTGPLVCEAPPVYEVDSSLTCSQ